MAKLSPLMLAPLVIFAGFVGLAFIGLQRDNPNELPSALKGKQAPTVEVTALGAGPVFGDGDLRDGKVKLVNYWASWCAPCRVEHAQLMQLSGEGLPVFGINYKDDAQKALGFLRELGDPYTAIGQDKLGRTAINWGVYGVPETFVIDGKGNVVLRFAGPVTPEILEKRIRPALEAAASVQ